MDATIDEILGNKTRIRLLRSLYRNQAARSGREIARQMGLSHTHVINQLRELEKWGILVRARVGSADSYSFNDVNYMVKNVLIPLFEAEKKYIVELASRFFQGLGDDLLHAFLFGSMARGTSTARSDMDLVLVVKDDCDLDAVELEAAGITADAMVEFGRRIDALVLPTASYKRKVKQGKGMWKDFDTVKVELTSQAA